MTESKRVEGRGQPRTTGGLPRRDGPSASRGRIGDHTGALWCEGASACFSVTLAKTGR